MTKTRFAPSPTGFLHIGGLRTALYAYLLARKEGGTFALRIEDTDQERFVEGGIENIIGSLKWAGISVDEGVDLDENNLVIQKGDLGPYIQSQRLEIYRKYITQLIEQKDAYYCFCTKERLQEVRNYQEINKLPTGYDGHCREIDPVEAQKRAQEGETHVIRMKMPKTGVTVIEDMVRGRVEFKNELIDDQVLIKADGFPTYHLAVVVDDHLMQFTHVIRGEEWLPSTPKHIKLYEMFGWEQPKFAHLSLMVNEQKQKLSKRHGSVSVQDFVDKGYLPEALINFIAFLGWNPGDEREIFSLAELEKEFDMSKVSKAAAVFNLEKLNWYNKQYIMTLESSDLAKRCEPLYTNKGINIADVDLKKIVELEKGRANTLVEIVENTGFIFAEELVYEPELLIWKKSTKEDAKEKLTLLLDFLKNQSEVEWTKEILEPKTIEWISSQGFGNGDVLWPTRVALSGLKNSPSPFELMGVLGKEKSLQRIKIAIHILS